MTIGMREIRGRAQTKGRSSQKKMAKQYSSALIVAASDELRDGLRSLLTAIPEIALVTEAHDSLSALKMVQEQCPDLVFISSILLGDPVQKILEWIRGECSASRYFVLAGDVRQQQEAIGAGVDAVALTGTPASNLINIMTELLSQVHQDQPIKTDMHDRPFSHPEELQRLEHDLRNVFTALVTGVDLINRKTPDPTLQHRLSLIQAALEQGMEILDKMRDLSSR